MVKSLFVRILTDYYLSVTPGTGANLQGSGYIQSVQNISDCVKICDHVDHCELVSFDLYNNRCYLKIAPAKEVS